MKGGANQEKRGKSRGPHKQHIQGSISELSYAEKSGYSNNTIDANAHKQAKHHKMHQDFMGHETPTHGKGEFHEGKK